MLADTPTESSVSLTFLLRFFGGVAEREREYDMVFIVSKAHHTLWDKVGFVMTLDIRTSAGEPFGLFDALLGTLFEVLVFSTFEVIRLSESNSGRKWVWGWGLPKENDLHAQPQGQD